MDTLGDSDISIPEMNVVDRQTGFLSFELVAPKSEVDTLSSEAIQQIDQERKSELNHRHNEESKQKLIQFVKDFQENIKKRDITIQDQAVLINEQRSQLQQIAYEAITDSLTGLPNRKYFDSTLVPLIEAAISSRVSVAIMIMDLQDFKDTNDMHGHKTGDKALQITGEAISQILEDYSPSSPYNVLSPHGESVLEVLSEKIRVTDKVFGLKIDRKDEIATHLKEEVVDNFGARIGGDEFCLVLTNIETQEQADQAANRLSDLVSKSPIPIVAKDGTVSGTIFQEINIGTALFNPNDVEHNKILEQLYASYQTNHTDKLTYAEFIVMHFISNADGKMYFNKFSSKQKKGKQVR